MLDTIQAMKLISGEVNYPQFVVPGSPWLLCGSLVSGMQHLPGQDGVSVVDQGVGELSQLLH